MSANLRNRHPGLTIDGVTKSYRQWGRETGLSEAVVWARVNKLGWSGRRVLEPTRQAHTEDRRSQMSASRRGDANPSWRGGKDASLDRYLRSKYQLSLVEYRSLEQKQGGVCAICGCSPCSTKEKRLSVDHCHATGRVRGLLCKTCNWILGQFKESPERFRAAATYLETK